MLTGATLYKRDTGLLRALLVIPTVVRLSSTGLDITPQTSQRLTMFALLTQFCVHLEKSRDHHNHTQNRPEPKTLLTELPYC